MAVTAEQIKALRELTGAGVLDCKKALEAVDGDMERAQQMLLAKGLAAAAKKAEREAKQGIIEAYVHMGKAAALVELNCETDFVARTPEFKELAHDLAMQVVAAQPRYVRVQDVPAEVLEEEKRKYRAQMADQNKPEHLLEKIVQNKLQKFYQETCILNQPFIKDEERTIEDVIKGKIATIGENIVLRRFVRFALAED